MKTMALRILIINPPKYKNVDYVREYFKKPNEKLFDLIGKSTDWN